MSQNRVKLQIDNEIALVTLNRPDKHNAIDLAMFEAIDKTVKKLKHERVRAVIVNGKGESFCSGLDVKSVLTDKTGALRLLWKWLPGNANMAQRVSIGWRRLEVPVIMALHGKCWGGGMQIALGGDFRIASPDCSLAIMEAKWGLIPDMGGTPALLECMPVDHAMKLAMTAQPISAQESLENKLITQIAENPLEESIRLAEELRERSPDTNRTIKKMYHKIWCQSERRILAKETLNQIKVIAGKNQRIATKRALGNKELKYR
ncbi:MAG: crotonase/enoyl-CoA hydratase family protein [Kangiellaceae bacterium]|nr:crotonase/enoyl-CoA hydratase family protein [Kangiellaceae bacterium]MCW9000513.1 crotonase/enoyl-CoA hydratase family protein [Kangiellaceae bacterium]